MAKTRRDFTPEFRREVVILLGSSGCPQMQIAAELGIHPSMLRQWRTLEVSSSSYYDCRSRPESTQATSKRRFLNEVQRSHAGYHRRYGSPGIHAALLVEGQTASRGQVERLVRRKGIWTLAGREFQSCTTDSRHDLQIATNLLKQQFSAALPNMVWPADITCLPTGEGWLYLTVVLNLATRKIVGWSIRGEMRIELKSAAPMIAAQWQQPATGLIFHSDRSSQYTAEAYRKLIVGMKAMFFMIRTDCYDRKLLSHPQGQTHSQAAI